MFHSTLGRALLLGAGAAVAAAAAVAAVIYGQMKKELRSEAEYFEDEVSGKNGCEGTTEIDEKECCCGEKKFTEPTAVNDGAVAYDTTGDGKADTVCIDTDGDGQIDTVLTDTTGDGELDTALVDSDRDGKFDAVAERKPDPEEKDPPQE
ncbi:MAG: hypothetical protein IJ052_03755 [Oscillospiraceae bacterium]|nr:hypothetical protein [Oscillospiraceae bacterium]